MAYQVKILQKYKITLTKSVISLKIYVKRNNFYHQSRFTSSRSDSTSDLINGDDNPKELKVKKCSNTSVFVCVSIFDKFLSIY